jgi:methylphosphotriester-DNA--protein-cysteine methyltransferase
VNTTISEIAYALNITTRELERRFAKHVGMSPKKLARIYQFQSLFRTWPKVNSLTELAHAAGYYDQAHFIRSFREISGTTPQTFFKKDNGLTELFVAKSQV